MPAFSMPSDCCSSCGKHATVRRVSPGLSPSFALEWALRCDGCAHEWVECVEVVRSLTPGVEDVVVSTAA